MVVTKCLNTAVFMVFILVGKTGVDRIRACNADVVTRLARNESVPPPMRALRALRDAVLGSGEPAVFFVMLTNAALLRHSAAKDGSEPESVPFPGHVFVIERHIGGKYSVFQSYINQYDLSQHLTRHPEKLGMDRTAITHILEGLVDMLDRDVWTRGTSQFWKSFTGASDVHCRNFEGFSTRGRVLSCFRELPAAECNNHLLSLASQTLADISRAENEALGALGEAVGEESDLQRARFGNSVYGDAELFEVSAAYAHHTIRPLTHMEMKAEALQVISEINSLVYLQMKRIGKTTTKKTATKLLKIGLNDQLTDHGIKSKLALAPTVVLVHSPMCGHCAAMRPQWDAVVPRLVKRGINVIEVDAQTLRSARPGHIASILREDPSFKGVPHVVRVSPDMNRITQYTGANRDANSIYAWALGL
jgi:hypothetical protein